LFFLASALVQPQPGRTAVICRSASPTFRNVKVALIGSPLTTFPKSRVSLSNLIWGAAATADATQMASARATV